MANNTTQNGVSICLKFIHFQPSMFFYYLLMPSSVLILVYCLFKSRRRFRRDVCFGRPSVPWPINVLEEQGDRLSFIAAFSLVTSAFWHVFLNHQTIFDWVSESPDFVKTLAKLAACILVALTCYPVFATIALKNLFGYIIGLVYTIFVGLVYTSDMMPCRDDLPKMILVIELLQPLPIVISFLYLVFHFSMQIWKLCRKHSLEHREKHVTSLDFNIIYVRNLLKTQEESKTKQSLMQNIKSRIFIKHNPGFRFSISILAGVFVSIQFVYLMGLTLLEKFYKIDVVLTNYVNAMYKVIDDQIDSYNLTSTTVDQYLIEVVKEIEFWIDVFCVVMFFALACAFVVTTISLLFTLRTYRSNLLDLYKGNKNCLPTSKSSKASSIVVKATKYIGYQYSYALWGFFFYTFAFLVIILFCSTTVILVLRYDFWSLAKYWATQFAPTAVYLLFLMLFELFIINAFFLLKNQHGKRVLAFDNRKWFFNFQYFMLYTNAILGLASVLLRVAKAIVFGLWSLPRLDKSTLSRDYEKWDSGFLSYVSLIKLEAAHSNPVGICFVQLLLESNTGTWRQPCTKDFNKGECTHCSNARRIRIRNRWCLLITLMNNPILTVFKKRKTKKILLSEDALKEKSNFLTKLFY